MHPCPSASAWVTFLPAERVPWWSSGWVSGPAAQRGSTAALRVRADVRPQTHWFPDRMVSPVVTPGNCSL